MPRQIKPEIVYEILRLYAEEDSRGRGIYTQQQIADRFGVGVTTVNRIIKKAGPYRGLRDRLTDSELTKRAQESQVRLALSLGIPLPPGFAEPPEHAEQMRTSERLAQAIAAERKRQEELKPDNLLKELTDGTGTREETARAAEQRGGAEPPPSPLDE